MAPMEKLTQREEEILFLITTGLRDKDICERLKIAKETVRSHVKKILFKSKSRTRAMAAAKYTVKNYDVVATAFGKTCSPQPHIEPSLLRKATTLTAIMDAPANEFETRVLVALTDWMRQQRSETQELIAQS